MKHNIILRNLPKEKIQIDIWPFEIQGGFRGFQQVPNGLHYIAVLFHNTYPGFWCFIEGATVVKAFNLEKSQFIDADNKTTIASQALADSGAMNKDLIVFPKASELQWYRLTSHISPKNYDQIINLTPSSISTNINDKEVIAAYQMAFLKVIVCQPELLEPYKMQLWKEWIQAFYQANQTTIQNRITLFPIIIDLLILHQELMPKAYDSELVFIKKEAKNFIYKLEIIGDSLLSQKAKQYQFFIH